VKEKKRKVRENGEREKQEKGKIKVAGKKTDKDTVILNSTGKWAW
jgi:hypothetical protein